MNINRHDREPTFEEVYPKAEFSEPIRLSLVLSDAVLRLWARMKPGPNRTRPISPERADA